MDKVIPITPPPPNFVCSGYNEANPLELIVASLTKNLVQIQDDLYEQDGTIELHV